MYASVNKYIQMQANASKCKQIQATQAKVNLQANVNKCKQIWTQAKAS